MLRVFQTNHLPCAVALSCNDRLVALLVREYINKMLRKYEIPCCCFVCTSAEREIPDRNLPKIRENLFQTVKSENPNARNFLLAKRTKSSIREIKLPRTFRATR